MTYQIEYRPSVLKSLKKLPRSDMRRILDRIDVMAEKLPDPSTTKMRGNNNFHKIRIGNYRVIYEIHEDVLVILVFKIGHRKNVYKRLT